MKKEFSRQEWLRTIARKRRPTRTDMRMTTAIQRVLQWVDRHNRGSSKWQSVRGKLVVEFNTRSSGARYAPEDNVITVSCSRRPMYQLCILLHEIGHHLIVIHNTKELFKRGYPLIYDTRQKRRSTHKVDIVLEEVEAWNRGFKLAERLGLFVAGADVDEFNRIRARCLKTYFSWSADTGKYVVL